MKTVLFHGYAKSKAFRKSLTPLVGIALIVRAGAVGGAEGTLAVALVSRRKALVKKGGSA